MTCKYVKKYYNLNGKRAILSTHTTDDYNEAMTAEMKITTGWATEVAVNSHRDGHCQG